MAFIDNTAGEAALKKGYGKDALAFWGTAARRSVRQSRVQGERGRRGIPWHVTKDGHDWTTTPTPSPPSWSWLPRTLSAAGKAVDDLQGPQLSRHGMGGGGRRAGVQSAPCPVPPSFGGRNVGSRARSALASKRRSALQSAL